MLSYKEYKQLNESLYGAFNLGIKQSNILTPPIGATGATEISEVEPEATDSDNIEEAKKNCGKGMDCECEKENKKSKDKEDKEEDKEDKEEDKEDKEEDKEDKEEKEGLTAAQKKLPKALQDAILKKKTKKEWSEVMEYVESLLDDVQNRSVVENVRNAMNQLKDSIGQSKEMTEEEKNWWNSVNGQLGSF